MTTTAIATVPTTDAGAFDADWLLQPQGEARRLEAALRSFAERGFSGPCGSSSAIKSDRNDPGAHRSMVEQVF